MSVSFYKFPLYKTFSNASRFLTRIHYAYHSLPCLWQVKAPDYSNRQKRRDAYQILVDLCKRINPLSNGDYVKNKISNIRTVFKKEFKKVQSSRKSRASTDEIYIPRLWYYELLLFTVDQEVPRDSISNFGDQLQTSIDSLDATIQDNVNSQDIPVAQEQVSQTLHSDTIIGQTQEELLQPSEPTQRPGQKYKRKINNEEDVKNKLLTEAAAILSKADDELDAFGYSVASKLRRMSELHRL
ncbi:hypothetical protein XELAEV_18006066mg [Xenopus laevis]|uniref:MADF domain-containing protein n=1 Tax=Xenopus laevis TaxID=8355 RepID=A0A974E0G2_XENLA|nr:hypothetical protein XELAEV_18006066mg [Xenopus laevis]